MSDKKSNDTRARNFACVVYPESAPENWQEILKNCLIPSFISPLHENDINADGTPKKPHYHVVTMYQGKKSTEQAKEVFNAFNGVGCEVVKDIRSYSRYLCHLDNPEKAQYKPSDVVCLGGADYLKTIGSVADKYQAIREMIAFCEENDIHEYRDLMLYCMQERDEWFRILCDNGTYVMKEYLQSRHFIIKEKECDR